MIKFENVEVAGWEASIRSVHTSMNSKEQSDSRQVYVSPTHGIIEDEEIHIEGDEFIFAIGLRDYKLMKKLRDEETDCCKFLQMIIVFADITAPLYWWKEFDERKIGTVTNSCKIAQYITDKEFTLEDFSCEHLLSFDDLKWGDTVPQVTLECVIGALNVYRRKYLKTQDRTYLWQIIQLLPNSYNQKHTVMLSYEDLMGIYKSCRNYNLDEWRELCTWVEDLPYFELIMGKFDETDND